MDDNLIQFVNQNAQPIHKSKAVIKLKTNQYKMQVEFHGNVQALQTEKILTLCFENSLNMQQKFSAK